MRSKLLLHLGIGVLCFWLTILLTWHRPGGDIAAMLLAAFLFLLHLLVVLLLLSIHGNREEQVIPLCGLAAALLLNLIAFHLLATGRERAPAQAVCISLGLYGAARVDELKC